MRGLPARHGDQAFCSNQQTRALNEAFLLDLCTAHPLLPTKGKYYNYSSHHQTPSYCYHSLISTPIHLELARLKVHNPHILHNPLQTRHKLQMRRVLLEVVLPVFFRLELAYEAMTETALKSTTEQDRVISICAKEGGSSGWKGEGGKTTTWSPSGLLSRPPP